jgi:hypothetical protein
MSSVLGISALNFSLEKSRAKNVIKVNNIDIVVYNKSVFIKIKN